MRKTRYGKHQAAAVCEVLEWEMLRNKHSILQSRTIEFAAVTVGCLGPDGR